jgi:hypothetical protein
VNRKKPAFSYKKKFILMLTLAMYPYSTKNQEKIFFFALAISSVNEYNATDAKNRSLRL